MRTVTLNFQDDLLERVDKYAERHGMKRNAVLKKAFEYLEDHQQTVLRVADGKVGQGNADGWEP